jgi:hypothetical protein
LKHEQLLSNFSKEGNALQMPFDSEMKTLAGRLDTTLLSRISPEATKLLIKLLERLPEVCGDYTVSLGAIAPLATSSGQ